MMISRTKSHAVAVLGCLLVLAACGSSNGGGMNGGSTGGTISGTVVKGPVGGASVVAFAVTNGTMGAQVGGGTTDANGNFTISIGDHAGPIMLQATGGAYTDEATGSRMSMQAGDMMACAMPSVAAGARTTGIQITPLTSMAHERAHHMSGGITAANITSANAAVGAYFSVNDILHTAPLNPLAAGSGAGATQDAKNYGMSIAAMSQYAKDIGMASSSGIVTVMMDDASDGVMDGRMGTASIPMGGGMAGGTMMQASAGTSGLSTAMAAFIASSMNQSGVTLTDMQALVNQLSASSGQLAGAGGGTTNGMMSGTATKGPVAGGTVTAYAVVNGMMGARLGSVPTDASGDYSVSIGAYAGPVMLQLTGGTYTDEATGSTMPMMDADVMLACVPSVAAGTTTAGVQVTPLTSMACARAKAMADGMTDANVNAANTAVGSYFAVNDVLHTSPMNPTLSGSGAGATQDAKNYGMSLAAMSQYANTTGMTTSSSGMVTAMMDDASDGIMNGMMGSTSVSMTGMGGMMGGTLQATAGTSALAAAMGTFLGSTMNRSGVTTADMQPLMNQLSGSTGQLAGTGGGSTPTGMMSGTAFMGAMNGGTVSAYAVSNGTMGPQIATGTLDSSGRFSVPLGAYTGPVMLQVSGGTFMDEATGTQMPMEPGDVLTASVPSFAAGSTVSGLGVTPLTSLAQARAQGMSGGMTATNITTANTAVGNYFNVSDILTIAPLDPAQAGAGTAATQDAKDYGMTVAAMSEYARSVGMTTSSSGIVTALMKDASDGVMNGMMGSTSITMTGMGGMSGGGMMGGSTMMQSSAGTSGLATAMSAFIGSGWNRSGVSSGDMQTLIQKLTASTGTIQ